MGNSDVVKKGGLGKMYMIVGADENGNFRLGGNFVGGLKSNPLSPNINARRDAEAKLTDPF